MPSSVFAGGGFLARHPGGWGGGIIGVPPGGRRMWCLVVWRVRALAARQEIVMAKNSHHVVPAPSGGWSVKKSGTLRASKHFDRKEDAVDWGRSVSRTHGTELVIHRKDGTIQDKDSHGRDPLPP